MNRRFYKRCLLWLLPLLVAQALVPVGFMAVASEQGVTVGFCPVQSARVIEALGPSASSPNHDHHAHHHHAATGDAAADDAATDTRSASCPYALVRNAIAGTPVIAIAPVTFLQLDRLDIPQIAAPETARLTNSNRIRGPPDSLS